MICIKCKTIFPYSHVYQIDNQTIRDDSILNFRQKPWNFREPVPQFCCKGSNLNPNKQIKIHKFAPFWKQCDNILVVRNNYRTLQNYLLSIFSFPRTLGVKLVLADISIFACSYHYQQVLFHKKNLLLVMTMRNRKGPQDRVLKTGFTSKLIFELLKALCTKKNLVTYLNENLGIS